MVSGSIPKEYPNSLLPDGHCITDHNPFSPAVQPIFHPVMQSTSHQFSCKDTTASADSVKDLADVKVNNMYCSPLIIKPIRLVRHNLPLMNPCRLFPVTFLSFVFLEMASRRICSITISETAVRLFCSSLYIPSWEGCDACLRQVIRNLSWSLWPFKDDRKQPHYVVGQLPEQPWIYPVSSHGFAYIQFA